MTVYAEQLVGAQDAELVSQCQTEGSALITLDLDFADIRAYPPHEYAGLVILRLRHQDKLHVLAVLRRVVSLFELEEVEGKLWVVEEAHIRIRE